MRWLDESAKCHGKPPRILLLIRSLDFGGAERQAVTLALGLKERGWRVTIACFYAGGQFEADLEGMNIPLFNLGKRGRWHVIPFLVSLWRTLHHERPDILHGYMPISNLLSTMMRLVFPGMHLVWGVRASNVDMRHYDWLSRLSYWLERAVSNFADLIISNSEAGARLRISQGFPEAKMRVIPNGIDIKYFRFNEDARSRFRKEWRVPDTAILVGLVGRLDPMKGHTTFIQAASRLSGKREGWRFICVGDGPAEYKASLIRQAEIAGLHDHLTWISECDDMVAVYSALDITASSSYYGEGFSNAIAEAMSCGRPCVVTDVGDSALIVGELGIVVPPGDPKALASGMEQMYARARADGHALHEAMRARIEDRFCAENLAERTASELKTLVGLCTEGVTNP